MENVPENIVENILEIAIDSRASDIHFRPEREGLEIRLRIDGLLHPFKMLDKFALPNILSRVKVLAGMNIAEQRLPQDGHFEFLHKNVNYNIRVSSLPSILGETLVLRILNRLDFNMQLESTGLDNEQLMAVKKLAANHSGIVLITGPAGSGKTNLLYSILNHLNSPQKNIITLEDPVEFQMANVRQTQINETIGLTFAKAMRYVVRQDPDVIMLGEIRDADTAQMAFLASLIGILVFSTFHTFNVPALITRLAEMNLTSTVIAQCIQGVVSTNLLRKVCLSCRTAYQPSEEEKALLSLEGQQLVLYKGKGCPVCKNTGYFGRTGIFEVVEFDEEIKAHIVEGKTFSEIKELLLKKHIKTLKASALQKVKENVTTFDEVRRVLGPLYNPLTN